ncbi:peptidase G2 autoproteolytic cleavage domain-containing protein [Longirhabdus pacifica]|uniref:peptidase G2 autoproteolytic cleavage domain-containing protein n=1 Tax=Longirhabdus pacifica TaxID=2305227 RepID=UPI001008A044|nr:peptidase G2 autoproteolytic cleavage domain-containing protein [Longirhabdus pacifica]
MDNTNDPKHIENEKKSGNNKATGSNSHAEGFLTTASGVNAHSEGMMTYATGENSHAEGSHTFANGINSHAEGEGTSTNYKRNAHIMGRYGSATASNSWFLANGTSFTKQNISAMVNGNHGDVLIDGTFFSSASSYGEMFETIDAQKIEAGYFVTLSGKKVRKATKKDNYILGVTCLHCTISGNSSPLHWNHKFEKDEWERNKYNNINIDAQKNEKGQIIYPEQEEQIPIFNYQWDQKQVYFPRQDRDEWVHVSLVGQVIVLDDGKCKVDGYCIPNKEGVATKSKYGYRVVERVSDNKIRVVLSGQQTRKRSFWSRLFY